MMMKMTATFDVLSGIRRATYRKITVTPWEVAAALALTIDDFQDTAVLAHWRYNIAPTVLYRPMHAERAKCLGLPMLPIREQCNTKN